MPVRIPSKRLHGLRVLTQPEAAQLNYASITTAIHEPTEKVVMISMGKSNSPDRGVWIKVGIDLYELGILSSSVKDRLFQQEYCCQPDASENPPTFQQEYQVQFVSGDPDRTPATSP